MKLDGVDQPTSNDVEKKESNERTEDIPKLQEDATEPAQDEPEQHAQAKESSEKAWKARNRRIFRT